MEFSKKEMAAIIAEQHKMDELASSLTEAERYHIMNMGYFNNAIKGYLIKAMVGFDDEAVSKALGGLRWALDEVLAEDAAKIGREY